MTGWNKLFAFIRSDKKVSQSNFLFRSFLALHFLIIYLAHRCGPMFRSLITLFRLSRPPSLLTYLAFVSHHSIKYNKHIEIVYKYKYKWSLHLVSATKFTIVEARGEWLSEIVAREITYWIEKGSYNSVIWYEDQHTHSKIEWRVREKEIWVCYDCALGAFLSLTGFGVDGN